MKNISTYIAATSLLFLAACGSEEAATRQTIEVTVKVEEIVAGNIQKFSTTTGNVVPFAQAEVSTSVEGLYKPQTNKRTGAKYKIGDYVKEGDVVAILEDDEYVNTASVESKLISLEIAKDELESLITLETKGGATKTEIRNAELSVTSAEISYENSKISIEKMNVTAPISGTIVEFEHYTPNVTLSSGSLVMTIMDYDQLILNVSLSESTMNSVNVGQEVYITHYSLPYDTIVAKIDELSPVIDTDTRTYKGVVSVNNSDHKLKPGMFVKADIVIDETIGGIIISKDIIKVTNGQNVVYVADGTTAYQKRVTTGIDNGDLIEITSGLSIGDKLITDGYETLKDRSKIKINK
ncbi:MAG: efflux RND transporter periplasmic adaptor subunit [Rikenellaceae bacterium]